MSCDIRWIVYYQINVPVPKERRDGLSLDYRLENVELGRLTARNRAQASRAADRRWGQTTHRNRELLVQSEVSASVEGNEDVVGAFRRGAHQVRH